MTQQNETCAYNFLKKVYDIYVPIHGLEIVNDIFKNLTDKHLLNMIKIYKNVVFEREYKIKQYINKEDFIKHDDMIFAAKIYVNAIQNYLYE
jgi:hypothetical protein